MSPGRIIDKDSGRILLRVNQQNLATTRHFEGGELVLEEFPPGVRGGYRITLKDSWGTLTTEVTRRVPPGRTAPLTIETKQGNRNLKIESD